MKKMITIVAALALAFTVPTRAQLVLAPNPSPHTLPASITEAQFAAPLAGLSLQEGLTVSAYELNGNFLSVQFVAPLHASLSESITLTLVQRAAFLAAFPVLPEGETALKVRGASAFHGPKGPVLSLQFSP